MGADGLMGEMWDVSPGYFLQLVEEERRIYASVKRWSSPDLLSVRPIRTDFSEFLIGTQKKWLKKNVFEMSSV